MKSTSLNELAGDFIPAQQGRGLQRREDEIRLDFKDKKVQKYKVHCESAASITYGEFQGVEWLVTNSKLRCKNATLTNVKFEGSGGAVLELEDCKINGIAFAGNWMAIKFLNGSGEKIDFPSSVCVEQLDAMYCTLKAVIIRSKVKKWKSVGLRFENGEWRPLGLEAAELTSTSFPESSVDVQALFSWCYDLRSVDLQAAKIVDRWLELRDDYTGPRLFIVLILVAVAYEQVAGDGRGARGSCSTSNRHQ